MNATKYVAALLVAALLAGCGGGSIVTAPLPGPTLPPLSLTAPAAQVVAFSSTTARGTSGGQPVLPLFDIPDVKTNLGDSGLMFWGTKDATTGVIGNITEASVYGLQTPPGSVHAFFNNANVPALVRDDASGYSIAIVYLGPASLSVTLCDPSLNPLGQASATVVGGVAQGGDATDGGSCSVTLAATSATARTALAGTNINDLTPLAPLLSSSAYGLDLTFSLGAILKFIFHKKGPTTIPVGTPIALIFIGAALLFFPTLSGVFAHTQQFDESSAPPVGGLAPVYETPP